MGCQHSRVVVLLALCSFVGAMATAEVASAADEKSDSPRLYWKDGVRLDLGNDVKFKFGGRILADFAHFDEDSDVDTALGPFGTVTEFRAARLYIQGTISDRIGLKADESHLLFNP